MALTDMDLHSNGRLIIFCSAFFLFLFQPFFSSLEAGQALAVLKEVDQQPSEPVSPAFQRGNEERATSPYWRTFIWEGLPADSLNDAGRSQILEAYQQNDWKPFFIGARFELNEKGRILLERLHRMEEDAVDPAPYSLDTLQKEILHLEQLRRAFMLVEPALQDALAVLDGSQASETSTVPIIKNEGNIQLASNNPQVPLPERALSKEKEVKYRELFKAASELDLQLAHALVRFAATMHPHSRDMQIMALTGEAQMGNFLKGLEPTSPQYRALQNYFRTYRDLVSQDVRQPVIGNVRLQHGATGEAVRSLQKRLQQEGLFREKISGVFDAATQSAVKEFQRIHLLEEDGTVGQRTREWLNVGYRDKMAMISDAMSHFRLSETRLHERYIRINIPQFMLEYYKDGKIRSLHRVIVGKASGKKIKLKGRLIGENHTPPLVSAIEQVIINPRWYVSDRIRLEIGGQAGDDPSYFSRNGYVQMSSQYPWGEPRLFMLPGPSNPLGRVKFDFPNPYAIYLHDTPKKHLFQRVRRDFSHGCIRVERAQELAQILLTDDENPAAQKTQNYYSTNRQVYIRLEKPVPIIIEYQQVSFTSDNQVVFCGDPYGWFKARSGASS